MSGPDDHDGARRWRVEPGKDAQLHAHDAGSTAGAPGDREATEAATEPLHEVMLSLQNRMWAEAAQSLLVVLQGIDASGKDGTVSHVFRGLNPLGTRVQQFKVPSNEELSHDFLWRIHARTPATGETVIFNRSHYEDVLVARVHKLVPEEVWRGRYMHINSFEALLHERGTTVVKFFLHLSKDEQLKRLEERANDPEKSWKLQPADFKERELWDDYNKAFEDMLSKTSTDAAPWYVIPADHKWYRNWAISTVLIERVRAMNPKFPVPKS